MEPVLIRLRLGPADARYSGDLVAGATAMAIFGDIETEIALREGGDEGLCAQYHEVRFHSPLRVGDYIEATGEVVARGNRSRRVSLRLERVLRVDAQGRLTDTERVLAATADVTIVVGPVVDGAP